MKIRIKLVNGQEFTVESNDHGFKNMGDRMSDSRVMTFGDTHLNTHHILYIEKVK